MKRMITIHINLLAGVQKGIQHIKAGLQIGDTNRDHFQAIREDDKWNLPLNPQKT